MAGGSGIIHYLQTSDAITHGVAYVLLAMSIASWCFLIVKSWVLVRAKRQGARAVARFWQAPTLAEGVAALKRADRERVFAPLAEAALHAAEVDIPGALLARVERGERVFRALRQALNASQRRLEFGQVLLASVGSTAPFVGLLGTVLTPPASSTGTARRSHSSRCARFAQAAKTGAAGTASTAAAANTAITATDETTTAGQPEIHLHAERNTRYEVIAHRSWAPRSRSVWSASVS
ncbi:MAG: MotA/TolQ/ExbB proton channel family protein [uncultured Paraburkholderia sp.]|nr:MAG: MotA/TolQ/ExbB proton channel family protein [uncultured Paraburkholderia sp.]